MLTPLVAHAGQPPTPHDVWAAWNLDPFLVTGLVLAWWVYARGRTPGVQRPRDRWRARAFAGALGAIGIALVSPLEPLSSALASAHMAQHLLLLFGAAPLLAFSAPSSRLLRGSPLALRRGLASGRRALGLSARSLRPFSSPAVVCLFHVAALWTWHAAALYDAALSSPALHVAEHVVFVVTGVLFWRVIVGSRAAARVSPGLGILLVFGMSMQSVFLSLLLTFAKTPFYAGYTSTTAAWGLSPLADQQLAGVLMWVPAGFVSLGVALNLLRAWLGEPDEEPITPVPAPPERHGGSVSAPR